MKKIFSNPDLLAVQALATFLESEGFKVLVRGEERLSAAGGLAPTDCWPEIVLLEDQKLEDAQKSIARYNAEIPHTGNTEKWKCEKCGEILEAQFTECWRCQPTEQVKVLVEDASLSHIKNCFYLLLILNICLYYLSSLISQHIFNRVPEPILKFMQQSFKVSTETAHQLSVSYDVACIIDWIGLFLLFNFARYLYLGLCIWGLAASLIIWDYTLTSGLGAVIGSVSSMVSGAILMLLFFSPLAKVFDKEHNNKF